MCLGLTNRLPVHSDSKHMASLIFGSGLGGGEWSASRPDPLGLRRKPLVPIVWRWVGPTACL